MRVVDSALRLTQFEWLTLVLYQTSNDGETILSRVFLSSPFWGKKPSKNDDPVRDPVDSVCFLVTGMVKLDQLDQNRINFTSMGISFEAMILIGVSTVMILILKFHSKRRSG